MKPDLNQIYTGDCLDVMKGWPDNFVDTVLTDPPYGLSFMGKDWDHGVPGAHFWQETLRVAKPGALLLAFGGTRTYHRLAVAIEDAGWEIRDCLMWLYGSGFPKSLNVSKAIDNAKGAERVVIGTAKTNLTPYGNIGGQNVSGQIELTAPATELAKTWDGWGTALKPAVEPIILAMKPLDGTFAQNAEKWGVAGMNVDGARVGSEPLSAQPRGNAVNTSFGSGGMTPERTGRWPANVLLDEEAAGMFPDGESRFFYVAKAASSERNEGFDDMPDRIEGGLNATVYGDSRTGQVTTQKNNHPTVKPLDLMKYLVNLTRTPTGGIVLDPFCGSGTTLWAAESHNRPWLGIEMNPDYVAIAEARLAMERAQLKLPFESQLEMAI